jgi:hypothetical protein
VRACVDRPHADVPRCQPIIKVCLGCPFTMPDRVWARECQYSVLVRRNALVCSVISLPDAWYLADLHGHPLLDLIKTRISSLPSTVVVSGLVAEAYRDILQGIKAITRQILNGVSIKYAASHHPGSILPGVYARLWQAQQERLTTFRHCARCFRSPSKCCHTLERRSQSTRSRPSTAIPTFI